jgi:hypothetical protein
MSKIDDAIQPRWFRNTDGHWLCMFCNAILGNEHAKDCLAITAKKELADLRLNKERFFQHLDKIAYALNIDWWDGDFPIDEVFEKIKNEIVNKP